MPASAIHDVTLGGKGYMIKPGSYRKRSAPLMGAPFSTGDPGYSQFNLWQHWAQTSWVGGAGQKEWTDAAMFESAAGVDGSVARRLQLTRDLVQPAGKGYALDGQMSVRLFMKDVNFLYCLPLSGASYSALWKWDQATDSWSSFKTFLAAEGAPRSCLPAWNRMYVGFDPGTSRVIESCDNTTWTTIAYPTGEFGGLAVMGLWNDRLYCAFSDGQIWRLKPDHTWDGTTVFYTVPAGDGYAVAVEAHLGYLYFLTSTGVIYRTDGSTTGEVWRAPVGATGCSMKSFDGRLFVQLEDPANVWPETVMYQLSGSSMTELRRWGKEGSVVQPGQRMFPFGGRLYYGASDLLGMGVGFGLAVYDPVEDAHQVFATKSDAMSVTTGGNYCLVDDVWVGDVVGYTGYWWVSVRGYGLFRTPFTSSEYVWGRTNELYPLSGAPYGSGVVTSSTYDAGKPGVEKFWGGLVLDVAVPGVYVDPHAASAKVEISIDAGITWEQVQETFGPVVPSSNPGIVMGRVRVSVPFAGGRASKTFKWRVTLASSLDGATPVLYGVDVMYILKRDPQWQWDFTVVASERQELRDGSVVDVLPDEAIGSLELVYRGALPVEFFDIAEGRFWSGQVLVTDFAESVFSSEAPVEAEVRVTLLEAQVA